MRRKMFHGSCRPFRRLEVCFLPAFAALFLLESCAIGTEEKKFFPAEPDYSLASMWYRGDTASCKPVDVFYVLPTCVWDWEAEDGTVCHYMDAYDSVQRQAVDPSNYLAYSLFSPYCNFYSPYYRQVTMNTWFESEDIINCRYTQSHQDVVDAFLYYMTYLNQGRPFILAGHSQGAKAVIELLKHALTDAQLEQLVAAYVFGYSISDAELEEFPALKPAQRADDCGVVVCYNSVSRPDACAELFKDNVVCINPVNWHTDSAYAPASQHSGAVFFDAQGRADTLFHALGVRVRPDLHTLLIDGLVDEDYFIPSISSLFPLGNYHVQEINLYFLDLQKNIAQRIAAWQAR